MDRTNDSLGQAAREKRVITARCKQCGNAASFLAVDLVGYANPEASIASIRFRCNECDARDYEVGSIEVDRDRRPDMIVWRPTRLR